MNTTTTTVQSLARTAAQSFETARRATGDTETGPREDGEEYVRIKKGSPDWISEMVHEAHGEMFPDDWKYACISAACEWIAENDDPKGGASEFADQYVDVYNSDRIAWLASHGARQGYCDEAQEEWGADAGAGVIDRIGWGQFFEANEVYGIVLDFLERQSKKKNELA